MKKTPAENQITTSLIEAMLDQFEDIHKELMRRAMKIGLLESINSSQREVIVEQNKITDKISEQKAAMEWMDKAQCAIRADRDNYKLQLKAWKRTAEWLTKMLDEEKKQCADYRSERDKMIVTLDTIRNAPSAETIMSPWYHESFNNADADKIYQRELAEVKTENAKAAMADSTNPTTGHRKTVDPESPHCSASRAINNPR